ncbi:uncharacterized protein LOC106144706 [Ictidomys tridecemlineatus]
MGRAVEENEGCRLLGSPGGETFPGERRGGSGAPRPSGEPGGGGLGSARSPRQQQRHGAEAGRRGGAASARPATRAGLGLAPARAGAAAGPRRRGLFTRAAVTAAAAARAPPPPPPRPSPSRRHLRAPPAAAAAAAVAAGPPRSPAHAAHAAQPGPAFGVRAPRDPARLALRPSGAPAASGSRSVCNSSSNVMVKASSQAELNKACPRFTI